MLFEASIAPSWQLKHSIERELPVMPVGVTSAPDGLVAVT